MTKEDGGRRGGISLQIAFGLTANSSDLLIRFVLLSFLRGRLREAS